MTFFKLLLQRIQIFLGIKNFLCDSCEYDWGDACTRPERPNALTCPDYKPRSGR